MKKIIAALTLLLAFSINANAQGKKSIRANEVQEKEVAFEKTKKESPDVEGKNQAAELSKFLDLNQTQTENFSRLFIKKEKSLAQPDITPEKRAELSRVVEDKIRAGLDAKQMEKLEKNTDLFNRLTH